MESARGSEFLTGLRRGSSPGQGLRWKTLRKKTCSGISRLASAAATDRRPARDGSFTVVLLHRDASHMETAGEGAAGPAAGAVGAPARPGVPREHPPGAACYARGAPPPGADAS